MKENGVGTSVYNNKSIILSIVIILFFRVTYYMSAEIAQQYPDSNSYINFPWHEFLVNQYTNGRTPVYPAIIKMFKIVLGEATFLKGVVIFQIVISLLSIVFLYRTLILTTKNRTLSLVMSVIYGSAQSIIGWDMLILTESLSISGCVFFLYFIIHYIKTPCIKWGWCAIASALILTMIKPSFLLFNYGLFLFWIMRLYNKDERKVLKCTIIGSILVLLFLQLYSFFIFKWYGTFAITNQAPRHLLAACLRSGVYKYYPDVDLVKQIEYIFRINNYSIGYITTGPIMALFSSDIRSQNVAVQEFCNTCIKSNLFMYIRYLLKTMIASTNTFFYSINNIKSSNTFFYIVRQVQILLFEHIKIGHLYLLGFSEIVFIIWSAAKKKIFDWIHFGIAAFLVGSVFFVFVGTYADFSRSLIHLYPLVIVGITNLINELWTYVNTFDKKS